MSRAAVLCALLPLAGWAKASAMVQPGSVRPGDVALITAYDFAGSPRGTLGGRELRFESAGNRYLAVAGIPVELPPGTVPFEVRGQERTDEGASASDAGQADASVGPGGALEVRIAGEIEVVDPQFVRKELSVAKKFVTPPANAKRWIAEDQAAFNKAFRQPRQGPLFLANFAWPRPKDITAPYGDLRTYNGKKQSQHLGTDLDGQTGEPIVAANDGEVVMVRECYGSGNTVVVHHGLGLFTTYFHLSHFDVKKGAKVRQGELLGKVGKTGRVTGPHLHFGVKLDGQWVDPESLLRLDFFR